MTEEKEPTEKEEEDAVEASKEEPVEVAQEEPVEGAEDESMEGTEEAGGREFAFAMAPVVRIMKEELDNDKMIRSRVKVEMNLWLEKVCRKISNIMNRSEYTMVETDDFKTAIEPFEMIDDVEGERHRIVATLEKIKQDCDSLIRDVDRKFITYPGPPTTQVTLEDEESEGE
ncbi:MAG: hypothetical protein L6243_02110 [Candidatus Altiarchaeales archaeon]|nr:hypothetical protein [Candidatus Altiarchaeota archaeon]MCG2782363.1 hypothetical protein [Candidatus Altiarchaeales archaeon]